MPAPAKRTRAAVAAEVDDATSATPNPSASASASDSAPTTAHMTPPRRTIRRSPTRRATIGATPTPTPPPQPVTPSREDTTPRGDTPSRASARPRTRISLSRASSASAATTLARTASLTFTRPSAVSASVFRTPSRGANSSPDVLGMMNSPSSNASGGILTRAASMSAVPVLGLGQIKEMVSGGGSAPPPTKGGSDPDGVPGPSGWWGKGKENIPPPADATPPESSRKRLRVSRRASVTPSLSSTRTRSTSIASVRSESAGPAAPTSFDFTNRRTSSCLPSPSPSPSVATTVSCDRLPSPQTAEDAMDVDLPANRKGKRPIRSASTMLLTPPPSSPVDDEVVNALESVNVDSGSSRSSSRDSTPSFANAYRALKASLRLSSAPTGTASSGNTIVGREDEKAVLQSYLSLVSTCDVGMYVSGPPGTGKTALTTAVGRDLAAQGWRVAEVGVMGLKAADVWARIGDELGCGQNEEDVAAHLAQPGSRTFIILDEVDSLLPPPPGLPNAATSHVLSKIFSLPLISAAGDATVKLVAISNTLDLTVRANLVLADGAMPQVLPFRAYNATDMAAIVAARIAAAGDGPEAAKVDTRAVELLCRKVEAQNGDLRMCLGVLSSAVGLAEVEWTKKTGESAGDRPIVKVALPHVLKAFASHTQQLRAAAGSGTAALLSPTTSKIRSVPLQGRMVLVSLLVFLMRTRVGLAGCPAQGASSEALTVSALYATYAHLLSHGTSPFPPSPESDYRDLLSNLETLGLVKLASASGSGRSQRATAGLGRIELCVREDEVKDSLGISAAPASLEKLGMAEQEVLRIWQREDERVVRVRARAAAAIERAVHGLEDPF